MKIALIASVLALYAIPVFGQQKAQEGTYQISIPSAKFSENLFVSEQTLEEIESLRDEEEDRNVILTNGMKVKVISREGVDDGRRVFKWKLEQE